MKEAELGATIRALATLLEYGMKKPPKFYQPPVYGLGYWILASYCQDLNFIACEAFSEVLGECI